MLNKMLKIMACCVFACSLSHEGKASLVENEEILSDVESPRPTSAPLSDIELAQSSSDQASPSSTAPTDTSITTEEPTSTALPKAGKRRTVLQRNSTSSSKSKGSELKQKEEEKKIEEVKPVANLSADMTVESSSPQANMFAAWASYLLPTIKPVKSPTLFAPDEFPAVYILLAMRADEIKGPNDTHSMIYIPPVDMFIGFRGMLYGKENDLKKALKFDDFIKMQNLENALRLLCITTEEDLEKILNQKDMEMAEELLKETQKELSLQTHHLKVKRSDTDKRPDQSTLARLQKEKTLKHTESNLASYMLNYTDGKLFIPEQKTEATSSKSKKEKKKKESIEEEEPKGIQFLVSVTRKIKDKEKDSSSTSKASTSKSKKSGSTTPRKRAKSKGATANAASSSATFPSQVVEDSQPTTIPLSEADQKRFEYELGRDERVTEPSLMPMKKRE
ncbi:hypothetical protein IM40_06605 [Candidatus Paracaedimonas acanthamoebae]|nr:hypothetical protein IM40_06605 [Candidatus Paracaedimonas acanthamoebae]